MSYSPSSLKKGAYAVSNAGSSSTIDSTTWVSVVSVPVTIAKESMNVRISAVTHTVVTFGSAVNFESRIVRDGNTVVDESGKISLSSGILNVGASAVTNEVLGAGDYTYTLQCRLDANGTGTSVNVDRATIQIDDKVS